LEECSVLGLAPLRTHFERRTIKESLHINAYKAKVGSSFELMNPGTGRREEEI